MFSGTPEVIHSKETSVKKLVFKKDDAVAEAVLYKYPSYDVRTVICCSTMSGCPVGCRFCGAGDYFARSLTAEEIVFQADACIAESKTNPDDMQRLQIMFMSMGEPLLNRNNMIRALTELYAKYPKAALLISTIGPQIDYEWVRDVSVAIPTIGLQFSVHKTTDAERDALIPYKAKLDLKGIAREGGLWHAATGRKPFFNYCAGPDNVSDADADRLRALFDPEVWNCTISVICERNAGMPARNDYQLELATNFSSKMLAREFDVRVFDPAGQDDISGGCGQLGYWQDWAKNNADKVRKSCGHGLPEVHTPKLTKQDVA